jgi:hypothetical protein
VSSTLVPANGSRPVKFSLVVADRSKRANSIRTADTDRERVLAIGF